MGAAVLRIGREYDLAFIWLSPPYLRVPEFGLGMVVAMLYISMRNRQQQQHIEQQEEGALMESPSQL